MFGAEFGCVAAEEKGFAKEEAGSAERHLGDTPTLGSEVWLVHVVESKRSGDPQGADGRRFECGVTEGRTGRLTSVGASSTGSAPCPTIARAQSGNRVRFSAPGLFLGECVESESAVAVGSMWRRVTET